MTMLNKLCLILSGLGLVTARPDLLAQMTPGAKVDVFKSVKPGQWAQIEGTAQADQSVLATEVKILTGDFEDDDWEIFGAVRGVDPVKKEFEILSVKVRVNSDADYDSKDQPDKFKSFTDIRIGQLLEAEGTYLKNGVFLAEEVQDKSIKKADEAGMATLVGKVEKVDAANRAITLMGITFHITPKTQAKSAIK